ncbi:hypothetical protein OPV22_003977 [Ensete ventricosum]|uniref:Uncharacterized protein n=1 Tax=Ensete ventricosum TaxID=4639 RepID=A0AAV8S240_ENSVE|nr:hypothetical protein OPV22_003977 [Ensete ventricosum]
MVDVGRHRLEWAAGALDDLQRRGLFSRSKNAGIVRRRCDLDYRLKRLIPADAGHYRLHFVMRGGYTAFATSGSKKRAWVDEAALGIYPSWKQGSVGRLLSDGKEGQGFRAC